MFDVENEFDTICAGDLVEYEIRKGKSTQKIILISNFELIPGTVLKLCQ